MKFYVSTFITLLLAMQSCGEYTPRPTGYNRIEFPERESSNYSFSHFSFEYPDNIRIDSLQSPVKNEFWFNIVYPDYGAVIHLTYLPITRNELPKALEDSYHLAYSHAIKADEIRQVVYTDNENRVSGIYYEIGGDVATPLQFFVTDSLKNFLRGSFYYSTKVNVDSISPVTEHVKEDIYRMIESFRWHSLSK